MYVSDIGFSVCRSIRAVHNSHYRNVSFIVRIVVTTFKRIWRNKNRDLPLKPSSRAIIRNIVVRHESLLCSKYMQYVCNVRYWVCAWQSACLAVTSTFSTIRSNLFIGENSYCTMQIIKQKEIVLSTFRNVQFVRLRLLLQLKQI